MLELAIQLGRRNPLPAQRLAVMDKFKKKIQEQAKENMSIGGSPDKKGYPNGETLIKKQTHTDKETNATRSLQIILILQKHRNNLQKK